MNMNDLRHSSDYGGMGSVRDSSGNRIGIGSGYNQVFASLGNSDFNHNGFVSSSLGGATNTSSSVNASSAGNSNSNSFMKDFQGQAISDMTNSTSNSNSSSSNGTWQYEYFNNLNLNGTSNLDNEHEPNPNSSSHTVSSSSNANGNTNINTNMNTKSVPVKYTIYWDEQSSAFTLTLRIPVQVDSHHHATRDTSPFQKVVSNGQQPSKNDQGRPMETHALRIPIAHILSLSSQTKSTNNHQDPTPWLDKTILRSRINDGGKAIGLVQTYTFQTVAAVEETAIKLPQWCPRSTEAINVEIHLSKGIVTLLANVCSDSNPGSGNNTNAISSTSSSNHNHSNNPSLQKYNVLNESSGKLLATAPSFPPPEQRSSSSSSSNSLHLNDNNTIQGNSYNNNSNNIFNAPTWTGTGASGSPFATSWGSSFPREGGGGGGNNGNRMLGQQQHLSNFISSSSSSTQFSDKNMLGNLFSSNNNNNNNNNVIGQGMGQGMNMNNMNSSAIGTGTIIGAASGGATMPTSYFDNTLSTIQADSNSNALSQEHTSRPDPSMIIGPLLNMGFNREECEAAANAIRNISMNGHSLTMRNENDSLKEIDNNQHTNNNQNHHDKNVENISKSLQSRDSRSYSISSSPQQSEGEDNSASVMTNNMIQGTSAEEGNSNSTSNSVWGNAGKMKIIKIPTVVVDGASESDEVTIDSDEKVSTTNATTVTTAPTGGISATQSRAQKMVKILDIPPELNAFVFHCNAQTRDECLSRGLFG
jgi:hypothetical protein